MDINKHYLNATDVAQYMGVSVPTAYKVMQQLNKQLKKDGYIVVSGRVPATYFIEKTYGNGGEYGRER